jgi:biopolymer transport protein ExbB
VTPEARVGLVGLSEMTRGREAAAEAMASAKSRERLNLEKRLGILGTLGNNAPFIGLFGTVLGIIKAFADLAQNQGSGGAAVVMKGISEALVATAMGLLVAIPAVIAFNVFKGKVKDAVTNTQLLSRLVLAELKSVDSGRAAAE